MTGSIGSEFLKFGLCDAKKINLKLQLAASSFIGFENEMM
jgi:hypothetical protein